jgi:predicted DNA-binding transcriptional regulator YafY
MQDPRSLIGRALQQVDDLVIVFDYVDAQGISSRRVVSPYRLNDSNSFLGLCLTREEPRRFQLARCRNLKLDLAHRYVMPVIFSEETAAPLGELAAIVG